MQDPQLSDLQSVLGPSGGPLFCFSLRCCHPGREGLPSLFLGNQILCLYLWPISYLYLKDKGDPWKPAALCSDYFIGFDINKPFPWTLFSSKLAVYFTGESGDSSRLVLISKFFKPWSYW